MKFSENWLREWVNPEVSTEELSEQLTMAGLEVDAIEPAAPAFEGVVVGEIIAAEPHPDADKLQVCRVNVGEDEPLDIVCGAPNARVGLRVPTAVVGARLPGDFKIKKAKLRGVKSFGMLSSAKELGLSEAAEGLMELPADAPVGQDFRDYLQLADVSIELGLTPNRSDCLSIEGIAREVGVLNRYDVNGPAMGAVEPGSDATFDVTVTAKADCPRYVGRGIEGINPQAETPMWMQEKLRRSGIRSLGPVVDVTNYVLLELGQPMHAFDLDKLDSQIYVRYALQGERLTLLDGKEISLTPDSLVIADQKRALALAGVMGGEDSAVDDQTTHIFLESAFFRPEIIAGKARSYGLHTDSSHRFERGVDTGLQLRALERATELILQICGGEAGPVTTQAAASHTEEKHPIHLRTEQIKRILGIEMPVEQVTEIFQRLGMAVKVFPDGWLVKSPSFRFDIQLEADLLEELVRIYGYNNIPRTQPAYQSAIEARPEAENDLLRLKQALTDRGYYEAITYSFVDPVMQKVLAPDVEAIALANPLSSEMSVMRSTIWAGLLQALKHNINRQQARVRLFETGLCFKPGGDGAVAGITQVPMFSGAICGDIHDQQWSEQAKRVDFFDLKADVEALLAFSGTQTVFEATEHAALHPGQSACIRQDGEIVGWLGALHPNVQKSLDIDPAVFVFELKQSAVLTGTIPAFRPLSRFPEVRRDLAIVVDEIVPVAAIMSVIDEVSSDLLKESRLFDVYQGQGVDEGRKSVAFGLILQEFSRTLTDHDVESEIENIVSALNQRFAATLRE